MSKQDLINSLTTSTDTEKSLWIEELEEGLDTLHKYEYEGTYPTTIRELLHLLLRLWTTGIDVAGGVLRFEEKILATDKCVVIVTELPIIIINETLSLIDNLDIPDETKNVIREYCSLADDATVISQEYFSAIASETLTLIDKVNIPGTDRIREL